MAMDLAKHLLGEGFSKLYRGTAGALARSLNMEDDIDENGVERAHRRWKRKLADDMAGGRCNPDDEHFYIFMLGELGFRLFRENCVAYTGAGSNTSKPSFLQHQMLLQDFGNEYTLLELIRGVHVDIYYSLTRVRRLAERPALIMFDPAELAYIFAQIHEKPERLHEYPALLRLER